MQHTVNVIDDPDNPGEYLLDLGLELCSNLGWQPGDTIIWIDNEDGTWTLQKQPIPLTPLTPLT
jgi:hypothetical protein